MTSHPHHLLHNTIIRASAGTGKTHALVQTIIHLLAGLTHHDRPIAPREIVAITFTEKAAGEMLERIRGRIEQLAQGSGDRDGTLADSARQLERPLPDESHWRGVRQQIDQLTATTFHSFCLSLLQRYPLEAGLDPGFEVYDEAVAGSRLEEAAELEVLAALEEEPAGPAAQLAELVGLRRRHEFSAAGLAETLARLLRSVGESGLELAALREMGRRSGSKANPTEGELAKAVVELVERLDRRFTQEKRRQGQIDFLDMQLLARSLLRAHPAIRQEVKRRIAVLLVDEFQDTNPIQRDLVLLLAEPVDREFDWLGIDQEQGLPAGYLLGERRLFAVGDPKQSIYDFRGADVSIFTWMESFIRSSGGLCSSLQTSYRSRPLLLEASNRIFEQLLQPWSQEIEPWFIHWSDDAALNPHRAETIGAPALHLLDSERWCIERSIERGKKRPVRLEQSLEFGAIAELLLEMVQSEKPWLVEDTASGRPGAVRPARFRDIAILLRRFVNALPELLHQLHLRGIPTYVVRGGGFFAAREVIDLAVALKAVSAAGDAASLVAWLRGPMVGLSDDALAILGMHLGGIERSRLVRLVTGKTKPTPTPLVIGTATNQPPPQDRQVSSTLDPKRDRLATPSPAGGSVMEQLRPADRQALMMACQILESLELRGEIIGPADCLSALFERSDYLAVLSALPDAEQVLANVHRVHDLARQYQRATAGGLAGFAALLSRMVEWEPSRDTAQLAEEMGDAVRVMTIHQSKGLDFPIALIAEADSSIPSVRDKVLFSPRLGIGVKPQAGSEESDGPGEGLHEAIAREHRSRQLAERRRLLYVAFTRARDHAVISGNTPLQATSTKKGQPPQFTPAGLTANSPGWMEACLRLKPLEPTWLEVRPIEPYLDRTSTAAAPPSPPPPDHLAPLIERIQTRSPLVGGQLLLSVTALGEFQICPRRYWLRQEIGLDMKPSGLVNSEEEETGLEEERSDEGHRWPDLRPEMGTLAHLLLEKVDIQRYRSLAGRDRIAHLVRLATGSVGLLQEQVVETVVEAVAGALDGEIGALLAHHHLAIERESGFLLHVPCGDDPRRDLFLRGQIDLCLPPDGDKPGVVLDYKFASPDRDLNRYSFQLSAYTLSLHQRLGAPAHARYRAGIVFLRESRPQIRYLPGELTALSLEVYRSTLGELGRQLFCSRQTGNWPKSAVDPATGRCPRFDCPYREICGF
ncbi:MAG: UvrD-helicase domain-containing protein [Bradymonadales bacterium]|nr:UvrD-helicase domain-containing protein [Bradymonadales bacterium]